MSQWYYADRQRHQHGPLPASELARLHAAGTVDAATLVWREGMEAWRPLGALRAELGLEEAPATLDFRAGPEASAPVTAPVAGGHARPPEAHYAPPAGTSTDGGYRRHAGEVVHAGLWRRFAASCIDGLVTGVVGYALLIPLMLAYGVSMSSFAQAELAGAGMNLGFMLFYYAISFGVPALYFAWMHSSSSQASLGKMAVGARVVRGDGSPIGFGRAFLRYLAYFLFVVLTCGIGVLVSGLMVAFTERKQAPHDMVCDTLVVDKWAFTDHPERQQQGLGTVTVVVLVLFGLFLLGILALGLAMVAMIGSMGF